MVPGHGRSPSTTPVGPFPACRLILVGTGLIRDERVVAAMSRTGDKSELLRGPLFYVLVLFTITLVCWRNSPIGTSHGDGRRRAEEGHAGVEMPTQRSKNASRHQFLPPRHACTPPPSTPPTPIPPLSGLVVIAVLCGGDGLADIFGRRYGQRARLPWNQAKSWAGSAAMLGGSLLVATSLISLYHGLGLVTHGLQESLGPGEAWAASCPAEGEWVRKHPACPAACPANAGVKGRHGGSWFATQRSS